MRPVKDDEKYKICVFLVDLFTCIFDHVHNCLFGFKIHGELFHTYPNKIQSFLLWALSVNTLFKSFILTNFYWIEYLVKRVRNYPDYARKTYNQFKIKDRIKTYLLITVYIYLNKCLWAKRHSVSIIFLFHQLPFLFSYSNKLEKLIFCNKLFKIHEF